MLEKEMLVKTSSTELDLMTFLKEYNERCEEIIAPVWIGKKRGNLRSFGAPVAYEYINKPSTKFTYLMKSDTLGTIETEFDMGLGIKKQDQFQLKKQSDDWKISFKKSKPAKASNRSEVEF